MNEIAKILNSLEIREIPLNRNYWFIRTYGGRLFNEYLERDYVAIGFNKVPYKFIKEGANSPSEFDRLKDYLENNYNLKKGEDTKWANQLLSFENKLKIGDVIVIPSDNSNFFSIGEIISDTIVVDDKRSFSIGEDYEPYPEKRKNVRWLKKVARVNFVGDTRSMIQSQMAISSINFMSDFVESNISGLYFRGNMGHFTLRINQDEDINAFDLSRLLNSMTNIYKALCKELGEEDNEDLFIKIKVQSKGSSSLKGIIKRAVVGLAIISMLPKSEASKIKIGNWYNYESEGNEGLVSAALRLINGLGEGAAHAIEFFEARENLEAEPIKEQTEPLTDVNHNDSVLIIRDTTKGISLGNDQKKIE